LSQGEGWRRKSCNVGFVVGLARFWCSGLSGCHNVTVSTTPNSRTLFVSESEHCVAAANSKIRVKRGEAVAVAKPTHHSCHRPSRWQRTGAAQKFHWICGEIGVREKAHNTGCSARAKRTR
jgi:hypothetical protein